MPYEIPIVEDGWSVDYIIRLYWLQRLLRIKWDDRMYGDWVICGLFNNSFSTA